MSLAGRHPGRVFISFDRRPPNGSINFADFRVKYSDDSTLSIVNRRARHRCRTTAFRPLAPLTIQQSNDAGLTVTNAGQRELGQLHADHQRSDERCGSAANGGKRSRNVLNVLNSNPALKGNVAVRGGPGRGGNCRAIRPLHSTGATNRAAALR